MSVKATNPGQAAPAGFTIDSEENVHTITYRKTWVSRPMLAGGLLCMVLLTAMLLVPDLPAYWLGTLAMIVLIAGIMLHFMLATGTFHVSRFLYSVNGSRYDRRNITMLYAHMPFGEEMELPIASGIYCFQSDVEKLPASQFHSWQQVKGTETDTDDSPTGLRRAWQKLLRAYGRCNCSIGFLEGGERVPLATGLQPPVALALFQRLVELSRG